MMQMCDPSNFRFCPNLSATIFITIVRIEYKGIGSGKAAEKVPRFTNGTSDAARERRDHGKLVGSNIMLLERLCAKPHELGSLCEVAGYEFFFYVITQRKQALAILFSPLVVIVAFKRLQGVHIFEID